MESRTAVEALGALAQDSRLQVYRLLVQAGPEGVAASEIAERLKVPANTLSFHLKALSHADLILSRPDGRFIYYSANYEQMNSLLGFLTENCCGGRSCKPLRSLREDGKSRESPLQRAVPVHRQFGAQHPGGSPDQPLGSRTVSRLERRKLSEGCGASLALKLLQSLRFPTEGLRSKSWDEFAVPGAPPLDFVFTVCDNAAGEVCPFWPGQPMTAHWGVPDPAAVQGSELDQLNAFRETFRILENRIKVFTSLPLASIERIKLQEHLDAIGKSTGQPD